MSGLPDSDVRSASWPTPWPSRVSGRRASGVVGRAVGKAGLVVTGLTVVIVGTAGVTPVGAIIVGTGLTVPGVIIAGAVPAGIIAVIVAPVGATG